MDFMHKQLVSAAGRDALTSVGAGAGIGAGVGAANALITGNDSLLGGATSGAMLGAGAGAAMRFAGAKYGSGLMAAKAAGEDVGTGLQTTMFTKAVKGTDPQMSFMGHADDAKNMSPFMEQANAAKAAASGKGAANATSAPTGASIKTANTSTDVAGPRGTTPQDELQRQANRNQMKAKHTGEGSSADLRHADAQAAWDAKFAGPKAEMEKRQAKTAARQERNEPIKATGIREKAKEQSVERRQQRMFEGQVADDIRSVQGDLSQMGNFPYTPNEIAAGFKKTGKSVDDWATSAHKQRVGDAKDQADLSAFRTQTMRDHLTDQGNRTPGLSNSNGPSASLSDVFKYMNGA